MFQSPEVEPKYSLLLHVCKECKEYIAKKQVIDSDWFIQKPKTPDIMEQFVELDETFRDLTIAITSDLEQVRIIHIYILTAHVHLIRCKKAIQTLQKQKHTLLSTTTKAGSLNVVGGD